MARAAIRCGHPSADNATHQNPTPAEPAVLPAPFLQRGLSPAHHEQQVLHLRLKVMDILQWKPERQQHDEPALLPITGIRPTGTEMTTDPDVPVDLLHFHSAKGPTDVA